MATNSRGTSHTDDDPTSELPALSESATVKQPADQDAIPVLTDVTESLPVLTDILHPGPASEPGPAPEAGRPPQAPSSDPGATTDAAAWTVVGDRTGNELHRRVEEQECRLREAIDQLDRVKEQAAWVRDALLNEQRDRGRLEAQVSELLGQRVGDRPRSDATGASDPSPVPAARRVTAVASAVEPGPEPEWAPEPAAAAGAEPEPRPEPALDPSLASQLAALTDYIACRGRWWHDMEQLAEANRLRIRELELEVAQRTRREAEAQTVAERESGRARELQEALIGATREIERLRRSLSARRDENGRFSEYYGTYE